MTPPDKRYRPRAIPLALGRQPGKIIVSLVIALLVSTGTITPAQAAAAGPINASIIVSPHPDDEMESWSLIENSPDNYEIFVYVTRGGHSGYCIPSNYNTALASKGNQTIPPNPTPPNRDTTECKEARINSTVKFLKAMGQADASLPQGYTSSSNLTLNGLSVRKYSGGSNGMALFFDIGDGVVNSGDVVNVVNAVTWNKSALGIPSGLKFTNILGGYRNITPGCYYYNHNDHHAVHSALWSHDFGTAGGQLGSSCANDPDITRTKNVTASNFNHAFAGTGSNWSGAHHQHYGWLSNPNFPTDGSGSSQTGVFNVKQTFWSRF